MRVIRRIRAVVSSVVMGILLAVLAIGLALDGSGRDQDVPAGDNTESAEPRRRA